MKYFKTIIFVLTVVFAYQSVYPQSLINKNFKGDLSLDSALIQVVYSVTQKNVIEETKFKADTVCLDIGLNWSEYYDPSIQKKDSLKKDLLVNLKSVSVVKDNPEALANHIKNSFNETVINSEEGISYIIYKNRLTNYVLTLDRNGSKTSVMLEEDIPPQDWTIYEDTRSILNYICRRATTVFRGREYEVFFTSDIPINDGPWKLYGLPGLILKAKSSDGLFSFEAVGIKKIINNISLSIDRNIEVCKDIHQYQIFLKGKSNDMYTGFLKGGNLVLYKSDFEKRLTNIEVF